MLTHPKPTVRILCKLAQNHLLGGVASSGIWTTQNCLCRWTCGTGRPHVGLCPIFLVLYISVWFYVCFMSVFQWSAVFYIFFVVCITLICGFFAYWDIIFFVRFYVCFMCVFQWSAVFLYIFVCFYVCLCSSDLRWFKDYIMLICGDLLQNKTKT